jgi:hypothetical protein
VPLHPFNLYLTYLKKAVIPKIDSVAFTGKYEVEYGKYGFIRIRYLPK